MSDDLRKRLAAALNEADDGTNGSGDEYYANLAAAGMAVVQDALWAQLTELEFLRKEVAALRHRILVAEARAGSAERDAARLRRKIRGPVDYGS